MPKPRKPQWVVPGNDARGKPRPGRWRTKIDGKFHYAPATIGRWDKPLVGSGKDAIPRAAWDWLHEEERKSLHRSTAGTDPTVYWLAMAYLKWAEGERDAGRLSAEQWDGQRSRLKLFWEWPGVADYKARSFPVDMAEAFFEAMRSGLLTDAKGRHYSEHYVAGVGRTVRAVFRWGARPVPGRNPTRLISANPLDGYEFPRAPAAVRAYVEGAVVRRWLRWCWARARAERGGSRRFDRLFVLMLWFQRLTGCRPGEACALRWDHWDRAAGKAILTEHKTARKTRKVRTIYVTRPVARILAAVERLPGRSEDYVFTHERGRGAVDRGFLSAVAGEPWKSGSAASATVRKWREEAIRAGVKGVEGVGPRKLVAYANRHGYASETINKGYSVEHTAEQLGNTPQVTAQTYAHSLDSGAKQRAEDIVRRGPKAPASRRGPSDPSP